jgi:hypothetical protein
VPTYNQHVNAFYALAMLFGIVVCVGIFALPIWALRRQNRMYPKGRDRIGRDPETAQATRRFETTLCWTCDRHSLDQEGLEASEVRVVKASAASPVRWTQPDSSPAGPTPELLVTNVAGSAGPAYDRYGAAAESRL